MKFVFEIEIHPDYTPEQYAQAWLKASEIIQQSRGARGTFLHRNLNDPNKLLAIAHWESKAHRDRGETVDDAQVKAIINSQARHVNFHPIGEWDEPEWWVLPEPQRSSHQ